MAATSSFTEGASVFGGQANLLQAIDNIFTIYNPESSPSTPPVCPRPSATTSRRSSTRPRTKARSRRARHVIHANTPSYVGSHVTGFANMVKAMVDYFAEPTGKKNGQVNVIPGWVEPRDMGEIKRLAKLMGVEIDHVPRHLRRARTARRPASTTCFPQGGRHRGRTRERRRQPSAPWPWAAGPRPMRPGCWTPSARCPAESWKCPSACKATDRFIDALRRSPA